MSHNWPELIPGDYTQIVPQVQRALALVESEIEDVAAAGSFERIAIDPVSMLVAIDPVSMCVVVNES